MREGTDLAAMAIVTREVRPEIVLLEVFEKYEYGVDCKSS